MRLRFKYVFCFVLYFLSIYKIKATHIVGGEIYYDYIGNDNYKITMKVYRDCLNGIPPFDSPAFFTIFNSSGVVVTTMQVAYTSTTSVPPSNNSPCAPSANSNACVEEAIYQTTVNLPPIAGGYTIAYQRCCRNGTIVNLNNPGGVGATYWTHIPGPEAVINNSSPRFTYRPPIYICNNNPIAFNHIASDPDGDSLVYSLCTPYNGLSGCCPVVGTGPAPVGPQCSSPPPTCPSVNETPPYISVPFSSPYSASYPLSSNPAININSQTGFLNGTPNLLGQWVVGVCVSEYRNGQLIGVHHRDFQFNVINCPFVVTAQLTQQTTVTPGTNGFCNGFTISYQNTSSSNSTAFFWDFGDPNTTTDTSYAKNPTYTFPNPGDYTVTLIANPGTPCADTAYEPFHVYTLLAPTFALPSNQCLNGNSFNFIATGSYQGNGSITWDFGTNATPSSANTATVNNVHYNSIGVNTVTLSINENGCSSVVTKTLEIGDSPIASIGNYNTRACAPGTFTIENTSNTGPHIYYTWTFSDGTTTNSMTPVVTFTNPGVYSFTLQAISNLICIDTTFKVAVTSITITPSPTASFSVSPSINQCFDGHQFNFTNSSLTNGNATYTWSFGANASTSNSTLTDVSNITYTLKGTYLVTLTTLENGCANAATQTINLYANPISAIGNFTPSGCNPLSITFPDASTSDLPLIYNWQFSDGSSSTAQNPTHIFTPQGVYSVSLSISTTSLCVAANNTLSVNSITVFPLPMSSFTASPIETSIFDPDISFSDLSSPDVVAWTYDFADNHFSTIQNPFHSYETYGYFNVMQTVTNNFGCINTSTLTIHIIPEFRFWIPNCFTPHNNDYLNQVFKPVVFGVENYTFMIFDRWGTQIYITSETMDGWDGSYKGKQCQMDVYVWKCEFKNVISKLKESHVGHVTLLD